MIKKTLQGSLFAILLICIIFFSLEVAVRFRFDDQTLPLPYSDFKRLSLHPTSEYRLSKNESCLLKTNFKQPELIFKKKKTTSNFLKKDENGLLLAEPNFNGSQLQVLEETGEVTFNTTYQFDDFGRRATPLPSKKFDSHTILVGCSFVFGMGLSDHETLAALLQEKSSNARAYTIALPGWSVGDVVASQEKTTMWDGIEPQNGMVLYNFSQSMHLRRFLGSLASVASNQLNSAYIAYDPHKKRYHFAGVYTKNKTWYVFIANLFNKSKLFRFIGLDWPRATEETLDNFAKAILQVKENYQEKYGNKNAFVVYFEPEKKWNNLIPYLEKYKIHYLDYTNFRLTEHAQKELFIKYDNHPTREYNRLLAEQISCDLKLLENKKKLNGLLP